jgi:hypothetical protein
VLVLVLVLVGGDGVRMSDLRVPTFEQLWSLLEGGREFSLQLCRFWLLCGASIGSIPKQPLTYARAESGVYGVWTGRGGAASRAWWQCSLLSGCAGVCTGPDHYA